MDEHLLKYVGQFSQYWFRAVNKTGSASSLPSVSSAPVLAHQYSQPTHVLEIYKAVFALYIGAFALCRSGLWPILWWSPLILLMRGYQNSSRHWIINLITIISHQEMEASKWTSIVWNHAVMLSEISCLLWISCSAFMCLSTHIQIYTCTYTHSMFCRALVRL